MKVFLDFFYRFFAKSSGRKRNKEEKQKKKPQILNDCLQDFLSYVWQLNRQNENGEKAVGERMNDGK